MKVGVGRINRLMKTHTNLEKAINLLAYLYIKYKDFFTDFKCFANFFS